MDFIRDFTGFDWDSGNIDKNWHKHRVLPQECEEVFYNQPLVVVEDDRHSQNELRYYALGRTDADRYLFLVFTIRRKKIRIISARNMSRLERKVYDA